MTEQKFELFRAELGRYYMAATWNRLVEIVVCVSQR